MKLASLDPADSKSDNSRSAFSNAKSKTQRFCLLANVSVIVKVDRRFTGDDVVQLLVRVFGERGTPEFIRSDNGPEFVSRRVQDFLTKIDFGTSYIAPGSPWENGYVESFHSRLRDECLAREEFTTLKEAQIVIAHWRHTYNHRRPHSGLEGMTPAMFARQLQQQTEPGTTQPVPS